MTIAESSLPLAIHPTQQSAGVGSGCELTQAQTEQRFILAQLDQLTLVFPSATVAEILVIERSQILALPFYAQAVLGCIHNAGLIVPLISIHQIVGAKVGPTKESLTVVRLSNVAGAMAGIGIVADRVLGSRSQEQLPPDVFSTELSIDSANAGIKVWLFRPEILSSHLWQPQRWYKK